MVIQASRAWDKPRDAKRLCKLKIKASCVCLPCSSSVSRLCWLRKMINNTYQKKDSRFECVPFSNKSISLLSRLSGIWSWGLVGSHSHLLALNWRADAQTEIGKPGKHIFSDRSSWSLVPDQKASKNGSVACWHSDEFWMMMMMMMMMMMFPCTHAYLSSF